MATMSNSSSNGVDTGLQPARKFTDLRKRAIRIPHPILTGPTPRMNEDAPAMAAGAAGDPGQVQNATSNYASQRDLYRKKLKAGMRKRAKPVM